MKARLGKNKKGFTLVELIVTIAIMAILAGAVTPAVYVTTRRRQKSAAETDTQTMYRNAISAVTYLNRQYSYPYQPVPRDKRDEGKNGWYPAYAQEVCKRIYKTVIGLDIPVKYYDPDPEPESGTENVLVPKGFNAPQRNSFVNADNKNPYIVIQVVGVMHEGKKEYYLIISYHNDKNQFEPFDGSETVTNVTDKYEEYIQRYPTADNPQGKQLNRAYQTNAENPIRYTYRIRTPEG